MCIIVYKPQGVAPLDYETAKICFENNPHGAGIALLRPEKKKVEIYKGFMSFHAFWKAAEFGVFSADIAAYHFRIATSGGTCPENCHPFPVSNRIKALKDLSYKGRYAFLHNGIIGAGNGDLSDTQLYIKDILSKDVRVLDRSALKDKIAADTHGSRTVLIDALTKNVILTGNWIEDERTGILFSNSSFQDSCGVDLDLISDICPDCGELGARISDFHGLYECPQCHALFDQTGEIWQYGD